MTDLPLTLPAARALHLAAQGLLAPPRARATRDAVLAAIRNMHALQIDTIAVVARSPYLVLYSRLGPYPQAWLEELLAEGRLFEYWAHEACFLPIEDYWLYRHRMLAPQGMGWKYNAEWLRANREHVDSVRRHLRRHGPSRSADFERTDGKAGGWWEWKPEKRALEVLFTTGEVMVARRHNFQRVYDLRERVHQAWDDRVHLRPPLDARRAQVLQAVRALGLARGAWVADYFRMGRLEPAIAPAALAAEGLLLEARVAGWDDPVYVHPDRAALLAAAAAGELKPTATRILSPFDPVVWDRRRALELFDFDYTLECYTPAPKRRYGYFTLPILRRGRLVGRMDAKAHRRAGVFEVKALHLEPGVRTSAALVADVAGAVAALARWHATPAVVAGAQVPSAFTHAWGEIDENALA